MSDHLEKLFRKYTAEMNRWEIAFNNNNGNMNRIERHHSKRAYWAYHAWKTAEQEELGA